MKIPASRPNKRVPTDLPRLRQPGGLVHSVRVDGCLSNGAVMSSDDSISIWIDQLKRGDDLAAKRLWERFFSRLLGLANKKLLGRPRQVCDEEDAVLSAFQTVFRRARAGQFPQLNDRHELWHLLVKITERKVLNKIRTETRQKRGAGRVSAEAALEAADASGSQQGLANLPSPEPTPEFVVLMAEAVERLLSMLDDDLRALALLKLESYSNAEIATRLQRSVPTIERRLRLIRSKWQAEIDT